MKKITLMLFAVLITTMGFAQSFSGTAGVIDDNNCATATNDFTATVTGVGTLGGTNSLESVTLNISHTWNSDLEVTLVDPSGATSLLLVDGVGGSGDGFTDCIIIDGAAALPTGATTPVTGSFSPTGPGAMADFNTAGVAADGDWTLSVCDGAGGDTGMVDSWAITFAPTPACSPPVVNTSTVVENCGGGTFTVDVDVTSLGDATSLTLSNDAGVGSIAVTAIGVATAGPFPIGTAVNLVLEHDQDSVCNVDLLTFIDACPAPNDNFAGAIPITPSAEGTGCATFPFGYPSSGTSDSGMDDTCAGVDTGLDRFFTWTATTDALLWNDGAGNPGIAIWDAAGTAVITCNTTFADPDTQLSGWTIGQDLVIQIYDFGASISNITFCLEEYTIPPPPVPPYLNDFSTFPGSGWTQAGSGDPATGPMTLGSSDWATDDFGNDLASPNGQSARINLWQAVDQEWLISPILDLTGAGPYYLNMDVALTPFTGSAATSFGSDDEVQVLITSDGGTTWVNLLTWNLANQPGTSREAATEVDLSSYAGSLVQIAIWATDGAVDDAEDNNFYVDNFQVTTSSLGLEDVAFESFKYFPNPVNGILSLRAQDNIQAVTIYNMLGQEVMRSAPNTLSSEVDLSKLQTGAYFVKVRINDVEDNFRIIKR